jgi:hypothetical protein
LLNAELAICRVLLVLLDKVGPLLTTWRKQRDEFEASPPCLPSQQGQTPAFEEMQKTNLFIACGWPLDQEGNVPLTLLHPVFGQFVNDCQKTRLMAADYNIAKVLREKMCAFYSNEGECLKEICKALQEYGIAVHPGPIAETKQKTDGHICTCDGSILIIELKNEIGWKGAEPSLQLALYFWVFCHELGLFGDDSHHPRFVIFVVGLWECHYNFLSVLMAK